jgi:predicted AlkP superfamily phosphohydrolase/phosphomutase
MVPKLLVVGWDGATFDLLDPWLKSGALPNLARLIDSGIRGPLKSVPNMNSGPAWTSVSTGLNPGKHGIYGLVGFAQNSYRLRPLNATDRRARALWQQLSDAGRRVIVVNLPMTYPADRVNGVLVAGGDAPTFQSSGFAYPPQIVDQIRQHAGDYIVADRIDGLIRDGHKGQALDRLLKMVQSRTRAALYLMDRHDWDLCMILFTASDSAQHYFWQDLAGGPHQDAILTIFAELDAALGKLRTQAGDGATTIVLSDHGFGEHVAANEFLNDFLFQLGLLSYRTQRGSQRQILRRLFATAERALGGRARAWLLERLPRLRGMRSEVLGGIDWANTRAFNLAGSNQIWINTRGLYPQGIVAAGDEYQEVVSRIQGSLAEATDPETGRPAVKAVHHRSNLYTGPYLDQAPDLLVEWSDDPARAGLAWQGPDRAIVAARRVGYRPFVINGNHRPLGILAAAGAPFKEAAQVEGATLYDMAPTIFYLLGHPISRMLDGRLLETTIDDGWLEAHPPAFTDREGEGPGGPALSLSTEDEDTVMARLRALGYVE